MPDQKNIDILLDLIKNDKKIKGSQIDFSCILSSEESNSTISNNSEIDLISNYPNKLFLDKTSEIKYIEENTSNKTNFEFIANTSSLQLNYETSFSDVESLYKKIKKDKSNQINIIYNNGFMPYLYSKENIVKTLNSAQSSGNLDKFKPVITNPSITHRDLRPDATHYYINFISEDIFPSFKIELYLKLLNGDSILLINECIPISDLMTFRNNKQKIDLAITNDYDSKYSFAIKESYIVDVFYKNGMKYLKSTDFPDSDDCTDCKYKTLYRQKFSINIKGCAPNVPEKIIPVGFLNSDFFLFQCSNKPK